MTTPPQELGAHDSSPESVGEHEEIVQADGKLLGGYVIGIRSERGMSPRLIDRGCVWTPPTAEFRDPAIENPRAGEVVRESLRGKVRQSPRARKPPNIDHELDIVPREQAAKLVAGTSGVTDRPNGEGHARTIIDAALRDIVMP
jgi:hypothetical protein